MTSTGQGDRIAEVLRRMRAADRQLSMYDAMQRAVAEVSLETRVIRLAAEVSSTRYGKGKSTLTSTEMDLMCRAQYAQVAKLQQDTKQAQAELEQRRAQRG